MTNRAGEQRQADYEQRKNKILSIGCGYERRVQSKSIQSECSRWMSGAGRARLLVSLVKWQSHGFAKD